MPTVPNQRVVNIHRDMPGEKEGSARFGNIRTNQDGLRFRIVVLVCDCHEFACAYSCIKHEQHNSIPKGKRKGAFPLNFRDWCDTIILPHKFIFSKSEACVFTLVKMQALLSYAYGVGINLCGNKWSTAFFGVWLHLGLHTFLQYRKKDGK